MQTSKNKVDEIAADWVALQDAASFSLDRQAELDVWLSEDPRHLGAYMRARAVLGLSQRMKAFGPDFAPDEFLQHHHAVPVAAEETREYVGSRLRRKHWAVIGSAIAACLLLVITLTLPRSMPETVHETQIGEQREMTLADASSISMNTDTRLAVAYSEDQRIVRLAEGEALFNIQRDPERPFFVETGNTTVRVLGTIFSVRHIPGKPVEVIVYEGRVHVERNQFFGNLSKELEANERAIIGLDTPLIAQEQLPGSKTKMSVAWLDGMIAFEDVSLADAATEFARYGSGRIRIDDPQIAQETITGLFDSSDPSGFAKAAALSLGHAMRREGEINIIERRAGFLDTR